MATENIEPSDVAEEEGDGTPVCFRCFRPIDPLAHYCRHCGEATGQLTHYIPFVNIPWQAHVWGQIWRQIWSRDVSIPGRIFRLLMIIWNVPIMLIGLFFRSTRKAEENRDQNGIEPDRGESPAAE